MSIRKIKPLGNPAVKKTAQAKQATAVVKQTTIRAKSEKPAPIQDAKQFNSALQAAAHNGIVSRNDFLKLTPPTILQNTLPTTLPTNSHLAVYPLIDTQKTRLDSLANQWPDPRATQLRSSAALLATAPQKVLDIIKLTPTDVPPPTIRILKKNVSQSYHLGDYYGWRQFELYFEVRDIDGIFSTQASVYKKAPNPNIGLKCQLPANPNWGLRYYAPWCSATFSPGQYTATISARGISNKQTSQSFDFSIDNPPATPPPTQYDDLTIATAAAWNVPNDTADCILKASYAINAADWDVTWYGTIEVVLNPDACKIVAAIAGAVAIYGVERFLEALQSGTWYALLIWGLALLQAKEVAAVLGSCAANNKKGKLCWNAPTGLFYAVEV